MLVDRLATFLALVIGVMRVVIEVHGLSIIKLDIKDDSGAFIKAK